MGGTMVQYPERIRPEDVRDYLQARMATELKLLQHMGISNDTISHGALLFLISPAPGEHLLLPLDEPPAEQVPIFDEAGFAAFMRDQS
jgi:hypothetical protein